MRSSKETVQQLPHLFKVVQQNDLQPTRSGGEHSSPIATFIPLSTCPTQQTKGLLVLTFMRVGVSARRGTVVGADDKWRCLFAGNRGANGFDCGSALARRRWRKHTTLTPSYTRNNEEIEDGASSRTRYLIVTLLHSRGNSEERARTARRPISSPFFSSCW